MSHTAEETVEDLKAENLELKLQAIKKELATFKVDMHRHLDLLIDSTKDQLSVIIKNTEKTNGSVARATEKIAELERQDNKAKVEELTKQLEQHKKDLTFFTVVGKNRWVARGIILVISLLYIQEVRDAIFKFLTKLI